MYRFKRRRPCARTCTVAGEACVSAPGFVMFCGHRKKSCGSGGRELTGEGMKKEKKKKERRLRHSQTDGDTV